jgi:hypothetical protein
VSVLSNLGRDGPAPCLQFERISAHVSAVWQNVNQSKLGFDPPPAHTRAFRTSSTFLSEFSTVARQIGVSTDDTGRWGATMG